MTPKDRIKRYAQLAALGAVLAWALLSFFLILSPRLRKLDRVTEDYTAASKQLVEMEREIEDARIAGPPDDGTSRFDRFGILGPEDEDLFLTDLIAFCEETDNILNLVRRADVARPATRPQDTAGDKRGTAASGSPQASSGEAPQAPQPTIERVPHNVTYSGTFLSSFELLQKLESYKRLLTVERMEVVADNQLGYPRVNGTITIDLFLVRNLPPLPPTAEAQPGAGRTAPAGQQPSPRRS